VPAPGFDSQAHSSSSLSRPSGSVEIVVEQRPFEVSPPLRHPSPRRGTCARRAMVQQARHALPGSLHETSSPSPAKSPRRPSALTGRCSTADPRHRCTSPARDRRRPLAGPELRSRVAHGARVDAGRLARTLATAANSAAVQSGIGQRPTRADRSRRAFRSATIVTPVRLVSDHRDRVGARTRPTGVRLAMSSGDRCQGDIEHLQLPEQDVQWSARRRE
jgi:hypothetical protein